MYVPAHDEGSMLVERHMDLIRRIAYQQLGRLPASVQADDLIQAGVLGLLEAARHYDAAHGASFETYAGIRIRGSMLDEVRRQDWVPRATHRDTRRIADAMNRVSARTGSHASGQEVADEMGVDLDTYHKMVAKVAQTRVLSLEDAFGAETDYADLLEGPDDDPGGALEHQAFLGAVVAGIDGLPEREQLVLSLYYDDELNLKEIGSVLGVSESRVCQIHGQALARLRANLTDWLGRSDR